MPFKVERIEVEPDMVVEKLPEENSSLDEAQEWENRRNDTSDEEPFEPHESPQPIPASQVDASLPFRTPEVESAAPGSRLLEQQAMVGYIHKIARAIGYRLPLG
eukprot:1463643-Rhodomonas_salina.1